MRYVGPEDCEVDLECLHEDTPIEGNASCTDPSTDRETAEWIRDQLDRGNAWAWCTVRVVARFRGFEGDAYLGCCSYTSERDFREGGYFEDLVVEAIHEINRRIAAEEGR